MAGQFWIFTDEVMVGALRPRLDALLDGANPPPIGLFARD